MFYVYILQSESVPSQIYIGYSTNYKERLIAHNRGESKHTSKFLPWRLVTCIAFSERQKAVEFESYLKSHSGRAFLRKRFF